MNPKLRGSSPETAPEPNSMYRAISHSLPYAFLMLSIACLLAWALSKFL
jgi:hypothetical protein